MNAEPRTPDKPLRVVIDASTSVSALLRMPVAPIACYVLAQHLAGVEVPMLFVQGTRDRLADCARMTEVVAELGPSATLSSIDHAAHGFDVRVRSGRTPGEVMSEALDGLAAWIGSVV